MRVESAPNKKRLKIEYRPANQSLRGINIKQPDLPDPSDLKAPIKELISIADSCTDELEAYSRYLGGENTSRNDVAALLCLPDELENPENSSTIGEFRQRTDSQIADNSRPVSMLDSLPHKGTTLPSRTSKKETSYGIAPGSRFRRTKPNTGREFALFNNDHGDSFVPSQAFGKASMALKLGSLDSLVATIDKHINDSEKSVLHKIIDHNVILSTSEKCSLHIYIHWRLNSLENMEEIKARLNKLSNEEKNEVSHILADVALADSKVSPAEIKQLKKLCAALVLDKSSVISHIHDLSSTESALSTGFHALSKTEEKSAISDTFNLDDDILALREMETKDVQNMLHAIFSDEEDTPETEAPSFVDSLDQQHSALFNLLVNKKKWTRNEIEEQCQKLGLMIDGAIETINEWSFDIVEAPVLDDSDSIYVDTEIVKKLKRAGG